MVWGRGQGVPWGGGPVIATEQPLSEIAGAPTSFDFTDEPDGRLPGLWEAYALERDGLGGVVWSAEPSPETFFRVVDGLALWQFTRSPALPPPATAYTERGYAAGPSAVAEGRNARASVIARQPESLLDADYADEFVYSVGLALRLDPSQPRWVGARMRARWSAGVWVEPFVLEVVAADGGEPVVLASLVPDAPLDIWRTQPNAEIAVELRGTEIIATVDGVVELTAQVPDDNYDSQVAVLAQVFNRSGPSIVPLPALVGVMVQSLRDDARPGPSPQIPGALHLEAPDFPMMSLPIRDLLDAKLLKQLRGRQFQFTQDTEVEVQHQKFAFKAGEVVRIREKLTTQEFTPTTRDLHFERSRRT
jgi:hypothetical protein